MSIKPCNLLEAGPSFQKLVWQDLGQDDEGEAWDAFANVGGAGYGNFTVQVDGVLNGATVELHGSIIPEKFAIVKSFTISDIDTVPPVDMIKPCVVGGDSETRVSIGLLATR